jgi:ribosome-binding ATPase YchF (GTP1/OBG family)
MLIILPQIFSRASQIYVCKVMRKISRELSDDGWKQHVAWQAWKKNQSKSEEKKIHEFIMNNFYSCNLVEFLCDGRRMVGEWHVVEFETFRGVCFYEVKKRRKKLERIKMKK